MSGVREELIAHIREQIDTPEKLERYCNDAKFRACLDKIINGLKETESQDDSH